MHSMLRVMLIAIPLAMCACTTLSDKDRALVDAASKDAAAARQQAAQASELAQQALSAAQKAQTTADSAAASAGIAASSADAAAQLAAQSAVQTKALQEKADRIYERSLRKTSSSPAP